MSVAMIKKYSFILTILFLVPNPVLADNRWEINHNPFVINPQSCQFEFGNKVYRCSKFVITKTEQTINYHFDIDRDAGMTLSFLARDIQQTSTEVLAKPRYMSLRKSPGINTYPGAGKCIATQESVSCSFIGAKGSPLKAQARFNAVQGFPEEFGGSTTINRHFAPRKPQAKEKALSKK